LREARNQPVERRLAAILAADVARYSHLMGEDEEGTHKRGSAAYRATAAEMWMPHHTALLARACSVSGQVEEAVTLLDDALQIVGRTGERWLEAELYRHKVELLKGIERSPRNSIAKPSVLPASERPNSGNCAPL
jgi:predicted ATPase